MKKCFAAIMFVSILSFCVTSCDFSNPFEGDFFYRPNDNNASDYSDRFETTFPNTYEVDLAYDYNDFFDHCYYSIDNAPTKGNVNLLVIPVTFSDYNSYRRDDIREDICRSFFANSDQISFESVTSYFEKSSYGNLSLGGYVTDWYHSTFSTAIDDNHTQLLVEEAVEWAKENYSSKIDFSSLDSDSDGYLDAVCLIYDAPNSYRENDNLWAYVNWIYTTKPSINSPNPRAFMWASYDFMYENQTNASVDAHTYIHEMGHILGLEDYYDYNHTLHAGAAGGAIMQSYNVGDHDPFSKFALGWINPIVPTGNTTITLKPFSDSGQVIMLTNRENANSPFDEYILIDYYTPSNLHYYDAYSKYGGRNTRTPQLPVGKGIRIWHVDSRLMKFNRSLSSYQITNNISDPNGRYTYLTSNSTGGAYACLDENYRDYRLLHLLQSTFLNDYDKKNNVFFKEKDMFDVGDVFSVNKYSAVFPNKRLLNDGTKLNFEIEVKELSNEYATIEVRSING